MMDPAHPLRGTCVPGCPMYGWCHCGCGEMPTIAAHTDRSRDMVGGRPFAFRRCHRLDDIRMTGAIPVERIRPLVDWLRGRYGTYKAVAELLGMKKEHLSDVLTRRRWVRPQTARKIVELVNAHRTVRGPVDTFDTPDVVRRLPLPDERDVAQRLVTRQWKAYYRAQRAGIRMERPTEKSDHFIRGSRVHA